MGGWRGIPPPPCRSCPVLTLMEVSCDALFSSVLTLMGVPCDTLFSSVLTLMGVPCDESPRHRFAAALPPLTRGARGRICPLEYPNKARGRPLLPGGLPLNPQSPGKRRVLSPPRGRAEGPLRAGAGKAGLTPCEREGDRRAKPGGGGIRRREPPPAGNLLQYGPRVQNPPATASRRPSPL